MSAKLHLLDQKYSSPLLQSSVSNDPSEIILICWYSGAQETFLIIINDENICAV